MSAVEEARHRIEVVPRAGHHEIYQTELIGKPLEARIDSIPGGET
jgi:hypothetical protein